MSLDQLEGLTPTPEAPVSTPAAMPESDTPKNIETPTPANVAKSEAVEVDGLGLSPAEDPVPTEGYELQVSESYANEGTKELINKHFGPLAKKAGLGNKAFNSAVGELLKDVYEPTKELIASQREELIKIPNYKEVTAKAQRAFSKVFSTDTSARILAYAPQLATDPKFLMELAQLSDKIAEDTPVGTAPSSSTATSVGGLTQLMHSLAKNKK